MHLRYNNSSLQLKFSISYEGFELWFGFTILTDGIQVKGSRLHVYICDGRGIQFQVGGRLASHEQALSSK